MGVYGEVMSAYKHVMGAYKIAAARRRPAYVLLNLLNTALTGFAADCGGYSLSNEHPPPTEPLQSAV